MQIIKQENLIPAKVVIKDKQADTEIFTLTLEQGEWTEKNGAISKAVMGTIPTKYKDYKINNFDIKVYNSEGKEIDILDTKKTTYSKTPNNQGFFQVHFKNKDDEVSNYAMWRVDFKDGTEDKGNVVNKSDVVDKVPTKVVLKRQNN